MKREDHPLTAVLAHENGRIPKVTVDLTPGHSGGLARRRPYWRARDGVWAVTNCGCPWFIKATGRGFPVVEAWTTEDYRAWEADRRDLTPVREAVR